MDEVHEIISFLELNRSMPNHSIHLLEMGSRLEGLLLKPKSL